MLKCVKEDQWPINLKSTTSLGLNELRTVIVVGGGEDDEYIIDPDIVEMQKFGLCCDGNL